MTLQLSGWLGKNETTNVPALAEQLAKEFDERHAAHDERPILIPVVGILRVETVRYSRDPDAEPVVGARLASLEAAAGGKAERFATAVRELWKQLQDDRLGTESLPLDWSGEEPPAAEEADPGDGERYDHGSDQGDQAAAAPAKATRRAAAPVASFSEAAQKRGSKE